METVNNIFTVKRLYECCVNIHKDTTFMVYSSEGARVYYGPYFKMLEAFKNQEVKFFDMGTCAVAVTLIN